MPSEENKLPVGSKQYWAWLEDLVEARSLDQTPREPKLLAGTRWKHRDKNIWGHILDVTAADVLFQFENSTGEKIYKKSQFLELWREV